MNQLDLNHIVNICVVVIVILLAIILYMSSTKPISNNNMIENSMVKDKYSSLQQILGDPTYIETSVGGRVKSVTWMSPLDNFNDFGKYGGCDYVKLEGYPSRKYHPYPAKVFLIVGKYMSVPDHLLGPLKYASETINIEQLFVPKKYAEHYYNTGEKQVALVTGSCASITISVITVQFVMDMINMYKDKTNQCLELYEPFRNEYDRRMKDYLCGKGITDDISWYNASYFKESEIYNIGDDKCIESFNTCEEEKNEDDCDKPCVWQESKCKKKSS